jgi:hypothetical protein
MAGLTVAGKIQHIREQDASRRQPPEEDGRFVARHSRKYDG